MVDPWLLYHLIYKDSEESEEDTRPILTGGSTCYLEGILFALVTILVVEVAAFGYAFWAYMQTP